MKARTFAVVAVAVIVVAAGAVERLHDGRHHVPGAVVPQPNLVSAVASGTQPATAVATSSMQPLGPGEQGLLAGTYLLDLVSPARSGRGPAHRTSIEIAVPSGWVSNSGWAVNDGRNVLLSFWDVDKVYPTGCRWLHRPLIDPGGSVEGLAAALESRPLRHASAPRHATLGGLDGMYLTWSVPRAIDFSSCNDSVFESWTGLGWASDRHQQGPGQVDRIWILDAHGQRLVVDANFLPAATPTERRELDQVVGSIRFLASR
jgi:hypothetical protein